MWDGKSYDIFQEEYQFKSGCYLIEKLEKIESLIGKSVLDLGCGNGQLTNQLAKKTKQIVTAIDSDKSMLAVLNDKYSSLKINSICSDIPNWLTTQQNNFDVIFSNATFHWFGSQESMSQILIDCHKNLSADGILAVRFSLKDNAYELKRYLAKRISEFLGNPNFLFIKQSELEYSGFSNQLTNSGFKTIYGKEIRFTPFSDPNLDFSFMINSQPIRGYFSDQSFIEFEQYLKKCWQQNKVKLRSHHAILIASKLSV